MRLDDEILENYLQSRGSFVFGDLATAEQYYRKNRAEHGVELYYEVDLKMPVKFVHPIGTVLGRATYAPYLVVYQNVAVGSDLDGHRPKFAGACVLFPGARVLGDTVIGSNVFITAGTVVTNCVVPDNCVVYPVGLLESGRAEDAVAFKPTTRSVIDSFLKDQT